MSGRVGADGLHWFDVELVSAGTGDHYNIGAGLEARASAYESDGYRLIGTDTAFSYSTLESVTMQVSARVNPTTAADDPAQAVVVAGKGLRISYERMPLIENAQAFMLSDRERSVCASPLARQLIKHYVRLQVQYQGGKNEDSTRAELERHIKALGPTEALDVGDIMRVFTRLRATSVVSPLELVALVHGLDRSITCQRSLSQVTTSRLAAFLPDVISLTRSSF